MIHSRCRLLTIGLLLYASAFTRLAYTGDVAAGQVGIIDKEYATPIGQSDVANGTTFVITRRGHYILSRDITFNGAQFSGQGVTADTQGNRIPVALPGATPTVILIRSSDVTLDLNNLSIITDDGGNNTTGIRIDPLDNDNFPISNVTIKNGKIHLGQGRGVIASSTDVMGFVAVDGSGNPVRLRSLVLSGLTIHDWLIGGIFLENVDDAIINLCSTSQNRGGTFGAAVGLDVKTATNVVVDRCSFSTSEDPIQPIIGVRATTSKHCTFKNSEARGNNGVRGVGFLLTGTCVACSFEECTAVNNNGKIFSGAGFAIEYSLNTRICNCQALSNTAGTSDAYGFFLDHAQYTHVECCTASHQNATSVATGAYGFYSTNGICNYFINCLAQGNVGQGPTGIGAGFAFENNEHGSTIECCKSISNDGQLGAGYGIKLGGTDNSVCKTVVQGNWLWTNMGAQRYGYKDFTPNSSTLLCKNTAFGHGKSIDNTGIVSDTGTMNYMLSYAGGMRNPANIIFETDTAELKTIDTAAPFDNISIVGPEC